ncbi:MAG: redoxin domain-containing protein [Thermoplasmata archaeon]|nr:redoxin domain-containing protein [Thermoplasmata archaeon]
MRTKKLVSLLIVVVVVALVAFLIAEAVLPARATSKTAPNFTLSDIYGHQFSLWSTGNGTVVVIEFTALSCSACQIVEQKLSNLYSGYNQTGHSNVRFDSIFIEPKFGDTIPALRSYHASHNITWTMAQDTSGLAVSTAYGVTDIPTVVIINKLGQATFRASGVQSQPDLQSAISNALAGTATPISIVAVSVFALGAIAGVTTFFSPCAFPMFPGYMSLYMGLNTNASGADALAGGTYKGSVRRALVAGSATASGMLIVFAAVGVALLLAADVVGAYIPRLLIVVGAILVALGGLLLTNLQYWRIVTPLQRLWNRLRGRAPDAAPEAVAAVAGNQLYVKLFGYGMGYAAAAAGCVAPVIFSAIIAGLAVGLIPGLINILIFSLTAALLMIAVTVLLTVAGKRFVNQLKAWTPVIKKVSAGALILVGGYLIYFYWAAWGF